MTEVEVKVLLKVSTWQCRYLSKSVKKKYLLKNYSSTEELEEHCTVYLRFILDEIE